MQDKIEATLFECLGLVDGLIAEGIPDLHELRKKIQLAIADRKIEKSTRSGEQHGEKL